MSNWLVNMLLSFLILLLIGLLFLFVKGVKIVPQQEVWIIQRLGKFHARLEAGPNWIFPFTDKISYVHSLKEEPIEVHEQTAVTQDNVSVTLDGILYVKIFDPIAASYGVKNPYYALSQLVKTAMRSEIGKIALDKCFEERESLNIKIVQTLNEAANAWGIKCLRYEIKDINIPPDIKKAMELQMTAERQKRARILDSEGLRQSQINESEGKKQAQINLALAEAEAVRVLSEAMASNIVRLAEVIKHQGADQAIAMTVAEKYIGAFKELAQKGTTILLPADSANAGSMVAQVLSIFDAVKTKGMKKLPETIIGSPVLSEKLK